MGLGVCIGKPLWPQNMKVGKIRLYLGCLEEGTQWQEHAQVSLLEESQLQRLVMAAG